MLLVLVVMSGYARSANPTYDVDWQVG